MLSKSWIEQSVFEIFKNIALHHPNNIALDFEKQSITYKKLLYHIENTAASIEERAKENKAPIAIKMNNHPDFIVAMFACLACGIPYVPLDNHFPENRNKEIVEHAKVQFILDELNTTANRLIKPNGNSNSLAYILYTSGSSGRPKGVFQNQKNLLHDVWQYINSIQLRASDRCTLFYSPSVNGAIRDIFGTLLSGATLLMKDLKKDGILHLASFVEENNITILHAIPPVFRTMLQVNNFSFSTVRLVYLAGDRIFNSDFELYKKHFTENAQLYIGIGSTENATIYRQWFLNHNTTVESELVPVGYAVDDREMTLLPETNEIQVTSAYMALGYWNDEALTLQYFQFNEDGSRTFNTGDIGEINKEGLLEFKGRKDKQIKINGYRVETDEIVAKLKAIEDVRKAAVILRAEKTIAYVELENSKKEKEIKTELSLLLPSFMIPYRIYAIEQIPILPNFKIDVQALKNIDQINATESQNISTPEISNEEKFKLLWCKYVSIESYDKNWSWRNDGGTSVDAVNFLVDIEKTFSISFPFEIIHNEMNATSIFENVKRIIELNKNYRIEKELPLVFVFHWLCGFPPVHRKIVASLSKQADVKIIAYPDYTSWKEEDLNFNFFCDALEKNMGNETRPAIFIGLLSGTYFAQEMSSRYKGIVLNNIQFNFVAPEQGLFKLNTILTIGKNILRKLSLRMTQEIKEHSKLLKTANLKKLNTSATVFVLNNATTKYNNTYLGWDKYYAKTEAKKFSFNQIQMRNSENYQLEIEKELVNIISL
ncbi:MAG: AMP-binding protein [Flavobacteriales bacterium]